MKCFKKNKKMYVSINNDFNTVTTFKNTGFDQVIFHFNFKE